MARTVKAPASPLGFVPQSHADAVRCIAMIGQAQRQRLRIQATLDDAVETLKADAEARARPLGEEIARLAQGLEIWAAANRDALTEGGKRKTAVLSTGELRWRLTPPAVTLKKVAAVIGALRTLGLERFLRTKVEIDKEAILREPQAVAGVPGIAIAQREEFVVVPNETSLEEVRSCS